MGTRFGITFSGTRSDGARLEKTWMPEPEEAGFTLTTKIVGE